MIVTITLNPALDKTSTIETLHVGQLNRLQNVTEDIGGKGINVSRAIAALGGTSVAVGFIGGNSGNLILKSLEVLGITTDFVHVRSNTRTNLKILDKFGTLTEFNEPGANVIQSEVDALLNVITKVVKSGTLVVMSGSLCQGVDADFYAKLIRLVHNLGGYAFLDTSGEPLRAAIQEKPDFVKPNKHELMEFFDIKDEIDFIQLKQLCLQLMDCGIPRMALSLGQDGAMFFDGKNYLRAEGIKVSTLSSVGAGDSMMGAITYAVEKNMPWHECVKLAVATSAGAVTTKGTNPPSKELVETLIKRVKIF